jgi:hypothetical protein
MPVDDVVAQAVFGNIEPARECSLDFLVAQTRREIEVGKANVKAATVETNSQKVLGAENLNHDRRPSSSMPSARNADDAVIMTSDPSEMFARFPLTAQNDQTNIGTMVHNNLVSDASSVPGR